MKLKLKQAPSNVHTELAAAVGWNVWNELFSCSDDQTVHKWNVNGEPEGKVIAMESYFTDLHWYPVSSKKNQGGGTDVFAVACTDGSFKIASRNGRLEKSVDAHRGAVISLRWSYDGQTLATAGEDGTVKIWSRQGMLRSQLSQEEGPVYSVVWAADCDQICYSTGSDIVLKSMASSQKTLRWKAHEGIVLKVDWSAINHMIVSGGEDCKYKVWDSFGRLLFQSSPLDFSVTAVAWCPSGDHFAVGSFNSIEVCDKMGWAYSKHQMNTGSILSICWTADGTQLAGAGGNGAVCFGQVVDVVVEDGRTRVTLTEDTRVLVQDLLSETNDDLDFRDRVIKISLGYEHLIVATATQCQVFSTNNWSTPHIFDLKDTVTLIMQCERSFMLLDNSTGIQIFTYEGRQMCNPKFTGLRTELLNHQMVSISNDTVAILDQTGGGDTVRFFDAAQARPVGDAFKHIMEIKEIALSQTGTNSDRQLIVIDRNRDLYLVTVVKRMTAKLGAMVDSAAWHDTTPMLCAMVDQRLCVWYCPSEVYVDKDMLLKTKAVKSDLDFGKSAQVTLFTGSKCQIRRSDGVLSAVATSPYPVLLYDMVKRQQWDKATRLCRFIKDIPVWAALASLAMAAKELNTAEVAFSAIEEVDKLRFVSKVKQIPTEEGRNAELALYRRKPEEAENILTQAGLVYRAIKLNIKLFRWDKAYDLAHQYKQHVDTVLWYRLRFLAAAKQTETNDRFQKLFEQNGPPDDAHIRSKIEEERQKEAQRPGAKRYV